MSHRTWVLSAALSFGIVAVGCGSSDDAPESTGPTAAAGTAEATADDAASDDGAAEQYPDVLGVVLTSTGDRVFTVDVTMSSPYDTGARYADAWRVLAPDGTVLGIRELLHDHASEQPFTRSLSGVDIPTDVDEVTVEGRDQISGWGGASVTVAVPPD